MENTKEIDQVRGGVCLFGVLVRGITILYISMCL